jgi:hypothetical protein
MLDRGREAAPFFLLGDACKVAATRHELGAAILIGGRGFEDEREAS